MHEIKIQNLYYLRVCEATLTAENGLFPNRNEDKFVYPL